MLQLKFKSKEIGYLKVIITAKYFKNYSYKISESYLEQINVVYE